MAEGIVSTLILKIGVTLATQYSGSVLGKEGIAKERLLHEIMDMKGELESLQTFLCDADKFRNIDGSMANFIIQAREIAFEIEDIIDEFTYKLGEQQGGTLSKLIKRVTNIKTWQLLSTRLQRIKTNNRNIAERRTRYHTIGVNREAVPQIAGETWNPAESAHFVKEDELVGIDKNKELLIKWLRDEKQQHQIISVCGMGGLGKTTLVTHVFNTIKPNFDACAWVSVSQNYRVDDLLRKIIQEFHRGNKRESKKGIPTNLNTMDYRSLVQVIQNYLQDKRYVLILDDMWDINAWSEIKVACSDGKSSCIVLTTRKHEVAFHATEGRMIELKPLQRNDAWDLFCKKAFWKNENRICPTALKHLVEKFLEKCNGLPIAIVSIGSLLSYKGENELEWENVYKDLEWQLTKLDKVDSILKLSLDDLPNYLKNCFLYCSIFPEDYEIERWKITRLWVAEGFVEERERRKMEEVAEDYLNELIHRCLLQVVEKQHGRLYKCRMHDIIRVLALHKSKEESFCLAYDCSSNWLGGRVRRLSILGGQDSKDFAHRLDEDRVCLRSLFVFESSISLVSLKSVLISCKLISVLDLRGAPIKEVPNEVFHLFNLRFLGLQNTDIEDLPKSIGSLQNLQTLYASKTKIGQLTKEVTALIKLRHIFVSERSHGAVAPTGIWSLKCLQTLQYIQSSAAIVKKIGALKELRTLKITQVRSAHCENLCSALMKMNRLFNLFIQAKDSSEVLQLEALQVPSSVQKFWLFGELEKVSLPRFFTSLESLKNLKLLALRESRFDEDPIPYLQLLHGLMSLQFIKAYVGEKLCFPAASFPKLQKLEILDAPQLKQIRIERGAMTSLNELKLYNCPKLKLLPKGIEYLTTVQILELQNLAEELTEKLHREADRIGRYEEFIRIRHIPKVVLRYKRGGKQLEKRIR